MTHGNRISRHCSTAASVFRFPRNVRVERRGVLYNNFLREKRRRRAWARQCKNRAGTCFPTCWEYFSRMFWKFACTMAWLRDLSLYTTSQPLSRISTTGSKATASIIRTTSGFARWSGSWWASNEKTIWPSSARFSCSTSGSRPSRTASLPRGSIAPPRRCTCKDFGSSKRIFFLSDAYLTLSDLNPYIGFKFVFDANELKGGYMKYLMKNHSLDVFNH